MDGAGKSTGDGGVAEFFGDLTCTVALGAPVTHAKLRATLDRLGSDPPTDRPVVTAPGVTVHFVSADAWHRHASDRGLRPADELAAREVHRRMAAALGAPPLPPRSDPFVAPE